MGIFASQYFDARCGAQPGCEYDRLAASTRLRTRRVAECYRALILWLWASVAQADDLRIATFAAPLSRDGLGLLPRDIVKGKDDSLTAITVAITQASPDILVLTDFDYDFDGLALAAFARSFGARYLYLFALRPNTGLSTGHDIDGNGWTGDARDAQGYGRFAGDGGIAILSRYPIEVDSVTDLSAMLWRDLPDAVLPQVDGAPFLPPEVLDILRLSSSAHWIVPIRLPDDTLVSLMTFAATPPVFDGPEDMNGLRSRDELKLWEHVLDGRFGGTPDSFVLAGNSNLDPAGRPGGDGCIFGTRRPNRSPFRHHKCRLGPRKCGKIAGQLRFAFR